MKPIRIKRDNGTTYLTVTLDGPALLLSGIGEGNHMVQLDAKCLDQLVPALMAAQAHFISENFRRNKNETRSN